MSKTAVKDKIKLSEKVGYGLGDFASNLVWNALSTFILFYYTDIIGLQAAIIGSIMFAVRLLDGVLDIVAGVLVDRTRSKHGKARPWLLWMSVPFGISTLLLFTIPNAANSAQVFYVAMTYVLINIIYTFINVPYGVLNSLITQDQYQRSIVNVFRMILSTLGTIVVTTLTLPMVKMFGDGKSGWITTFAVFAAVGTVMFLITFKTTKERVKPVQVEYEEKAADLKTSLKALFRNKYWLIVVLFLVTTFMYLGVMNGSLVYYAKYITDNENIVASLSLALNIPNLLVLLFFIAPLIKRFGKRACAMIGAIIILIGSLILLINTQDTTILVIGSIVRGVGTSFVGGTMFALLADTIEYGEWKSGVRTEGLVYSAGSFGLKVGIGLGTAMVGWGLSMAKFDASLGLNQMASAASMIEFMFIWGPVILAIVMFLLMYMYKLDGLYGKIIADLEARKQK